MRAPLQGQMAWRPGEVEMYRSASGVATCQSCGMPLVGVSELGTEANGRRTTEYCRFCYRLGAFTEPQITMEQMLELCATMMARERILPEAEARELLRTLLPQLRRWRRAGAMAAG